MTLEQLRTDLWEEIGEPPNCSPADADGLAHLNHWINRGYKKILFWKFGDGTQVRWPSTEGEIFFKTVVVTGTISSATTTEITLDSSAGANDDQYNGWVIETGSDRSLIVDYDGASRTATIATALSAAPTGSYSLYKRFMKFCSAADVGASENIVLSSVSEIKEVQKLVLVEDKTVIEPAQRTETFVDSLASPGRPCEYLRRGKQIIFDCPVDEELWFSLEYVRIPPDLADDDDEPELPEDFHDAILLWAAWRGYRWLQETDMAYASKRDLVDFMTTTLTPRELASEREEASVEVNF